MIRRVLEVRFGALDDDARRALDAAGPEALDRLAERAVTAPSLRDALRQLG